MKIGTTVYDLSIIIVNYNTTRDLIACIKSIHQTVKKIRYEIIVIDNNSVDQKFLINVLDRLRRVFLFTSDRNLGFAAANNIGIRGAKGSVILLLNPDTLIHNNAIEQLYQILLSDDKLGMVGPLIVDEQGRIDFNCARKTPTILTELLYHTKLANTFPQSNFFGQYLMTYWNHRNACDVDLISGACMMIKRNAINVVGLMDERFFLYGDDVEYCYRFRKSGYKIHFSPKAQIVHKRGQSTRKIKSTAAILSLDGMSKFLRYYQGVLHGYIFRTMMFAIYSLKMLLSFVTLRHGYVVYHKIMLWAIGMLKFDRDKEGSPVWKGIQMS